MSTLALEQHLKPLNPFFEMSGVTEICINNPGEIFVEKGRQFNRYAMPELEFGFIESLASLVAEFNHKEFPQALLSGALPNGERIQFVMPPGCEKGNIICSIRRHQMRDMSLDDYQGAKAFLEISSSHLTNEKENEKLKKLYEKKDILGFLKHAIEYKKNIIISGGTGTGKTTFLNACLKWVPHHERLITVEDVREVSVTQPNVAHLLFNENDASLNALQIFKACLRLRPDRIFLSELRGNEVWAFLRAANSGHPGSLSTVHADTPQGSFDQLIFMMQQAGSHSSHEVLQAYIQSIIHIVVQLKRCSSSERFMYVSDIYFDAIHGQQTGK